MVELFDDLVHDNRGMPELPDPLPSALATFDSVAFDDDDKSLWGMAEMKAVCRYLRGGKNLQIPDSFRLCLPERM